MLEARTRENLVTAGEPMKSSVSSHTSYTLLGTKINPITSRNLLAILDAQVSSRQQCIIAYQNLHGLHLSYTDEDLYALHQRPDCLVFVDGFPIYVLCRFSGYPIQREQRISGNDFIWKLLSLAEQSRWRIYFLGTLPSVVADASAVLRKRVPALSFRAHHGFFDPDSHEGAEIVREIRDFDPHLLIVCMGMPRQERWIEQNAGNFKSTSICAMGAILEYISGTQPIPPRWLGPIGLEWLYRFSRNPKRLWHRYLVEPWLLLANVLLTTRDAKKTDRSDHG
jgi:N-acetylglucosaminyldiphosphoundecaprenol N-acetyl-beta-D-mannosaminyltransferase